MPAKFRRRLNAEYPPGPYRTYAPVRPPDLQLLALPAIAKMRRHLADLPSTKIVGLIDLRASTCSFVCRTFCSNGCLTNLKVALIRRTEVEEQLSR